LAEAPSRLSLPAGAEDTSNLDKRASNSGRNEQNGEEEKLEEWEEEEIVEEEEQAGLQPGDHVWDELAALDRWSVGLIGVSLMWCVSVCCVMLIVCTEQPIFCSGMCSRAKRDMIAYSRSLTRAYACTCTRVHIDCSCVQWQ
jgi:hypothetical protein